MAAEQSDLTKQLVPSTAETATAPNPNGEIPTQGLNNPVEVKGISEAVRAKAERLYNLFRMGLPDLYSELDSELAKITEQLKETSSAMKIIVGELKNIKLRIGKDDPTAEDEHIDKLKAQHKLMGEQILIFEQLRDLTKQRNAKKENVLKIFEEIIQQLDKDNMLENLKPDLQQDPLRRKIFRLYQQNYRKLPAELRPKSSVQQDDSWTLPQDDQDTLQPRMRDNRQRAMLELFIARTQRGTPVAAQAKVKIDDQTIFKINYINGNRS